jgi:hypothetical protein
MVTARPHVPRLWPGSTIVCIAGGPSVTAADVDACHRPGIRVIAIKDAIRLAPWADVLYACDAKWWKYHAAALTFAGPRYALDPPAAPWATALVNTGYLGLELSPHGLRTGKNSGYQAINLAVHLGAARVVLLGYDMQPLGDQHHWFGPHPYRAVAPPYTDFLACFRSLVIPLAEIGVTVVNATRRTVLEVFPRVTLEEALA